MFQTYSELAQVSGLTAFLSLLIGFLLGGIVLIKAIRTKQRMLFLFFLCIIFTISPWYPSGGGYLYWLLTGNQFSYTVYVILGTIGIPIAILSWLDVYMTTINPEKKKLVLITYGILSIIFEIYLFYYAFFAPGAPVESMIGTFDNPENITDIDYRSFVLAYLAISIGLAVTTGIHFSLLSIKIDDNKAVKAKGKFLLAGFMCFGFSATFDALVPMDVLLLVIIRMFLMATTLLFYLGFILPKWAKKLLSID